MERSLNFVERDDDNAERLDEALAAFESAGGYTVQVTVSNVLKGLGFTEADFEQPCDSFSGAFACTYFRVLIPFHFISSLVQHELHHPSTVDPPHVPMTPRSRGLANAHRAGSFAAERA